MKHADYRELPSLEYGLIICFDDGWWSFDDLNNFESEHLLETITMKKCRSRESIWKRSSSRRTAADGQLTVEAHRQLEAMFNFGQLLDACANCRTECQTLRDVRLSCSGSPVLTHRLDLVELAHDLEVWPAHDLPVVIDEEALTGISGRKLWARVTHRLCREFDQSGATQVLMLMFKTPIYPHVRPKCMELLEAVLAVPEIALTFINANPTFLRRLVIICRDHLCMPYRTTALSTLHNLFKAVVRFRLAPCYDTLIEMQLIDVLIDCSTWSAHSENENDSPLIERLRIFLRFEKIAYRVLRMVACSEQFSLLCSDIARIRLLNHCILQVCSAAISKNTGHVQSMSGDYSPLNMQIQLAEGFDLKHNLDLVLATIYWLFKHSKTLHRCYGRDANFCKLMSELYEKYSSANNASVYSDVCDGIRVIVTELFPHYLRRTALGGGQEDPDSSQFVVGRIVARNASQTVEGVDGNLAKSEPDGSMTISPISARPTRQVRRPLRVSHCENELDSPTRRKAEVRLGPRAVVADETAMSTRAVMDFGLDATACRSRAPEPCLCNTSRQPESNQLAAAIAHRCMANDESIEIHPELDEMIEQLNELTIPSMYYQDSDGALPLEPKGASDYFDVTTSSDAPTVFLSSLETDTSSDQWDEDVADENVLSFTEEERARRRPNAVQIALRRRYSRQGIHDRLGMSLKDWMREVSSVDSEHVPECDSFHTRLRKVTSRYSLDSEEEVLVHDGKGQITELKDMLRRVMYSRLFQSRAAQIEQTVAEIDRRFPKQSFSELKKRRGRHK